MASQQTRDPFNNPEVGRIWNKWIGFHAPPLARSRCDKAVQPLFSILKNLADARISGIHTEGYRERGEKDAEFVTRLIRSAFTVGLEYAALYPLSADRQQESLPTPEEAKGLLEDISLETLLYLVALIKDFANRKRLRKDQEEELSQIAVKIVTDATTECYNAGVECSPLNTRNID